MPKSWFTVQALADGRTAQVAVRGYIGEWRLLHRRVMIDKCSSRNTPPH